MAGTKAVEESPGIVSMMRWVLRAMTYTYIFVVLIIISYWLYEAITKTPNWMFAGAFTGIVGTLKGVTELFKVIQKRTEVKGEIEELKTIAKDV